MQHFPGHWETATVEGVGGAGPASLLVKWDGDDVMRPSRWPRASSLPLMVGTAAQLPPLAEPPVAVPPLLLLAGVDAGVEDVGVERRKWARGREAQLKLAAADGDFSDDELVNLQGGHLWPYPAVEAVGAEPGTADLEPHGLN